MKTLTVTEGRKDLGRILRRVLSGEDIGIVSDGVIVGLRPVEVVSSDYALREYSLSAKELAAAEKAITKEIAAARAKGELTKFTGGKNDFR